MTEKSNRKKGENRRKTASRNQRRGTGKRTRRNDRWTDAERAEMERIANEAPVPPVDVATRLGRLLGFQRRPIE